MHTRNTKRRREEDSAEKELFSSSTTIGKRQRLESDGVPKLQLGKLSEDEPVSGMELSDAQEESFQELAILRRQNSSLKKQNEDLKSFLSSTLRRVVELNMRVTVLEEDHKDKDVVGPISDLPYEMIYVIFGLLPLADLMNCERVCKKWRESLLEWLQELDLSPYNNAVNNDVIQHLTKFKKLESLTLYRCKDVTDVSLSTIVENFPLLNSLDIFGCQVMQLSQLSALSKLSVLRIGDCAIDDSHLKQIPVQIRSLNLEWLPGVQNEGLQNLGHLTNLVSLKIEQNDNMRPASMMLPDSLIPKLKHLTVIRQMAFFDAAIEQLNRFDNLESLSLYWVPVTGVGFSKSKGKLRSLKKLVLKRPFAMGHEGFDHITKNLNHIKSLELKGYHHLDRESMHLLKRMTNLEELSVRCSRALVDEHGVTDLEFLSNMRLRRLELIEGIGLTSVAMKKIADTQEYTLESLTLSECNLLHGFDLIPLLRLNQLREFRIVLSKHLAEENFEFSMKPGGGVAFTVDPDYQFSPDEKGASDGEGDGDDLEDDDDAMDLF